MYDSIYRKYLKKAIHKYSRIKVTRDGVRGKWELLLKGYRVSVWGDGEALEMNGGNGCKTLNIINTTELYT